MTNEYNISDKDVNTEIAKMEDQFVKLGKFLDGRTPKEKLKTICDTRIITDFNQLYPLLKDIIHNINNWQSKTTIV